MKKEPLTPEIVEKAAITTIHNNIYEEVLFKILRQFTSKELTVIVDKVIAEDTEVYEKAKMKALENDRKPIFLEFLEYTRLSALKKLRNTIFQKYYKSQS